ncbi:hypothetical protein F8388_000678 [Cannabis sativa]|uniref:Uncharacterized protein n=1 Tax=Cannabis sativa TaxID=3483 RepID=A0A7J6HCA4_CANSA|nr:hypothetical protein F8388_000678 [Cannabis sativa]
MDLGKTFATNRDLFSFVVKRKWHSWEERKIDQEYDVVIVQFDGGCVSGSESDNSDWSIGWLEPHGPEFQSDDEVDNSFAVLVPCYGRGLQEMVTDIQLLFVGCLLKKHINCCRFEIAKCYLLCLNAYEPVGLIYFQI